MSWSVSGACRRFTPTGVGTIFPLPRLCRKSSVHPHGRGDNIRLVQNVLTVGGSPPRAWGQSRPRPRSRDGVRFTPTGVGTISGGGRWRRITAVHPHGRGDNCRMPDAPCPSYGSPPRAWGQCGCGRNRRRAARFTPTGVGTMMPDGSGCGTPAVHPHGRGDNSLWRGGGQWIDGSPPRAWGQWNLVKTLTETARFTPTGVGTMKTGMRYVAVAAVHPHGRGDNTQLQFKAHVFAGSPPRAWGQCAAIQSPAQAARFTPTGVGTIAEGVNVFTSWAVHPHGRGDNCVLDGMEGISLGSPPRAWGQ